MDAALFAVAGMATVDYGPTGAGAHEAVGGLGLGCELWCRANRSSAVIL